MNAPMTGCGSFEDEGFETRIHAKPPVRTTRGSVWIIGILAFALRLRKLALL